MILSVLLTSLVKTIEGNLSPIGWTLLFFGLLFYWLKNLNAARLAATGKPYLADFWNDNYFEIPTSLLSCVVLAIMSPQIPPTLMDMTGYLSIFLVGYSASSILNGLISGVKTNKP